MPLLSSHPFCHVVAVGHSRKIKEGLTSMKLIKGASKKLQPTIIPIIDHETVPAVDISHMQDPSAASHFAHFCEPRVFPQSF